MTRIRLRLNSNHFLFLSMFVLSLLLLPLFTSGTSVPAQAPQLELDTAPTQYDNVILISWDGVRAKWIEEYTESGYLAATRTIRDSGFNTTILMKGHDAHTDAGLAALETGYGADVNLINDNQFGGFLSVPDGYTTTERLEDAYGDSIQTGMMMPWSFGDLNYTYISQTPIPDSTFNNIDRETDVDTWFASESIDWDPENEEAHAAAFRPFLNRTDIGVTVWPTILINADYLGKQGAKFVTENADTPFYLRIHMTEPDQAGHGNGEAFQGNVSEPYLASLKASDDGVQHIIDALVEQDIYDSTLIIIGTDHGFEGFSHNGPPHPDGNPLITDMAFFFSQDLGYDPTTTFLSQRQMSPLTLAVLGLNPLSYTPEYPGELPWDFVTETSSTTSTTDSITTTTTPTTPTTPVVSTTDTGSTFSNLLLYLLPSLIVIQIARRRK